jgi:hypothetical protein
MSVKWYHSYYAV